MAAQKAFEEEEHPSVLTLSEKLCMSVFANDRQLDNAARFCFEHPSFIPVFVCTALLCSLSVLF
jgi:hypothetical protein